jgi:NAD(P)-dependent dehydrogenase (short-subunit alcohol dehydrogenase family)
MIFWEEVARVTGGSRGVGCIIARTLAQESEELFVTADEIDDAIEF